MVGYRNLGGMIPFFAMSIKKKTSKTSKYTKSKNLKANQINLTELSVKRTYFSK